MKICSVEGCSGIVHARALCKKHYHKYLKYGDPKYLINGKPVEEFLEERIMPITETGCWIWMGAKGGKDYGAIWRNWKGKRKSTRAHRFAWEHYKGKIPKGLWVLHKCDTPLCVNPDHLYLGTHRDNTDDVIKRGNMLHKLTLQDIEQMKDLVCNGFSFKAIGRMYSVRDTTVSLNLRNRGLI